MKNKDVEYICNYLLKIDWVPQLSEDALEILGSCDSKLEMMFVLGACDFIRRQSDSEVTLSTAKVDINGREYQGIWFWEPWWGWYLDDIPQSKQSGPSALLFVPQFRSPEKEITHDLALFYGDDNGSPKWTLQHVIEIDGYGVHHDRRSKDSLRDVGLSYPVHRFFEETDKPTEWFRKIVYFDAEMAG